MKGLVCDCRNAIRLTVTAGVSVICAGADVAARATVPNVMRKVLDIKNVSNTSYGTIGKTKPVVALRSRTSALVGTITEYIKAIGRSRKTNWLGNSVSGTGNTIRQRTLSMRSVNAPQIPGKQYSPLRELPQPVFQRLSSQLYMASLVWGSASMVRGGRTKERQYTPEHPEYVALTNALKGGYFSGFFEAVCVFLMTLGARAVVPASKLSALSLPWLQIAGIVMGFLPHLPASTRVSSASVGCACAASLSGRTTIRCMRYLSAAPGVSGGNTKDVSGCRQGGNSRFLCLSFLSDLRGMA